MRHLIRILGIILLAAMICNAQDKHSLTLLPKWNIGDAKIITESTSWYSNIKGDEKTEQMGTISKYSIEISDSTRDGYIINWKKIYRKTDNELNELQKRIAPNNTYTISTDSTGHFLDLVNMQELIKSNQILIHKYIQEAHNQNLYDDKIIFNNLKEIELLAMEPFLHNLCHDLTHPYLKKYGTRSRLNDTIFSQGLEHFPNISEGIPVKYATFSKEIDQGKVYIKIYSIFDYGKIKELKEKETPLKMSNDFEMNDYTEIVFDKSTGWINSILLYSQIKDTGLVWSNTTKYDIK